MKFKSLTIVLFLGVVVAMLNSCSESTTPDDDKKNYFPLSVGSYWVFAKYDVDTAGRKLDTRREDSVVFIALDSKWGRTAYKQMVYMSNGETEDYYFYSENDALYVTGKFIMPSGSDDIEIPIDLKDRWIKLADTKSDKWTILDTTLTNAVANIPAIGDVILNGTYQIKGEKGSTTSVSIGEPTSATVQALEFRIAHSFVGTAKLGSLPPVNITYSVVLKNYFADKIGMVKQTLIPSVIDLPGLFKQYIDGFDYVLLRYYVK